MAVRTQSIASYYKKGVPGGTAAKKKTTFGGFGVAPNGTTAAKPVTQNVTQTAANPSNGNKGSVSSNNDDATKPDNTTVTTPPASVTVPPGATPGQPIDISGLMPGSASYNEAVRYNQSLTETTKPPVGPDGPPEPVDGDVKPVDAGPAGIVIGPSVQTGGKKRTSRFEGMTIPPELVSQVPADQLEALRAAAASGPGGFMRYLATNMAQPWAKAMMMQARGGNGNVKVARSFSGGDMWSRTPARLQNQYNRNIQAQEQADWEAQQAQVQQQPQGYYDQNGYWINGQQPQGMQLNQGPYLQDTEPQDFSNWDQSGGIVDPRQLQYQQLMQQLPYFAAFLQGGMPQQGG